MKTDHLTPTLSPSASEADAERGKKWKNKSKQGARGQCACGQPGVKRGGDFVCPRCMRLEASGCCGGPQRVVVRTKINRVAGLARLLEAE